MAYQTAPLDRVREWREFKPIVKELQDAVIAKAQSIWSGYKLGGIRGDPGQFILGNILPHDVFQGGGASSTNRGSQTWIRRSGSPGSWMNIYPKYTVPRDIIHGFAGFVFPDTPQIYSALQWTITERQYPIYQVEELRSFPWIGGPAIIAKVDPGETLVVGELETFQLQGFQERFTPSFTQRVIPLGLAAYKQRNLIVTTQGL